MKDENDRTFLIGISTMGLFNEFENSDDEITCGNETINLHITLTLLKDYLDKHIGKDNYCSPPVSFPKSYYHFNSDERVTRLVDHTLFETSSKFNLLIPIGFILVITIIVWLSIRLTNKK